jgi:hypothetical protein
MEILWFYTGCRVFLPRDCRSMAGLGRQEERKKWVAIISGAVTFAVQTSEVPFGHRWWIVSRIHDYSPLSMGITYNPWENWEIYLIRY